MKPENPCLRTRAAPGRDECRPQTQLCMEATLFPLSYRFQDSKDSVCADDLRLVFHGLPLPSGVVSVRTKRAQRGTGFVEHVCAVPDSQAT